VGCAYGPLFYVKGAAIADQVARAWDAAGLPAAGARRLLDFGCGCGRALVRMRALNPAAELWGCDLDAEAIAWNRTNLAGAAQFVCNAAAPPTVFRDGCFDGIYAISVFTHLLEELQFAWLAELRRLLRPGGVLVASVHGVHYWQKENAGIRRTMETRGFDYRVGDRTPGLPDFYMGAFHSERYIRERWMRFLDLVAYRERYIDGLHDAVVMRRS
jgi:SAM-dependent methyltransferase